MSVKVDFPETIEKEIKECFRDEEINRLTAEAILIASYKKRAISRRRVGELLGLNYSETEHFFKEWGIPFNYSIEDFEDDGRTLDPFTNI